MNRTREILDARPLQLIGRIFAAGCGDTGDCVSSPGSDDGGGGDKRTLDIRNKIIQRPARAIRIR